MAPNHRPPEPCPDAGASLSERDTDAQAAGRLGAGLVFERRFASGDLATRAVLHDICASLAAAGLDDDDLGTVELVLAEVLNNIAEHSYGPGGGQVRVRLHGSGPCLRCEIADDGAAMPLGRVPQSGLPTIAPPAPLPEGGFGWHIVRCLVSSLEYRRSPAGNALFLTIPVQSWAG